MRARSWVALLTVLMACEPQSPETRAMAKNAFRSLAHYQGRQIVATDSGGLARIEVDGPVPIELGLSLAQANIQALAVHQDDLWLGSDGGLLHLVPTSCGYRVDTVLSYPVRALAKRRDSLEVITLSHGTYRVDARGTVQRVHNKKLAAVNRI